MASQHPFTVMIAVDGSQQAQAAFHWYFEIQHKPGNHIVLAHVREVVNPAFGFRAGLGVSREQWDEVGRQAEKYSNEIEQTYAKHLMEKNVPFRYRSEEGYDPGQQLCTIAKSEHVDMVVMGTRGQGTVRRTIMGSVSDYVLHHANVPVSIYRT